MDAFANESVIVFKDVINCIVFWTKDPTNILERLDELRNYKYYFQITIIPYDKNIERYVRNKDVTIKSFKKLSQGKHYNININTCSEEIDLSSIGIGHAKCIDYRLVSKIVGQQSKNWER